MHLREAEYGAMQDVQDDRDMESNEDTCSVCLDSYAEGDQLSLLPCAHRFHTKCIQPWVRQSGRRALCPLCKISIFHNS